MSEQIPETFREDIERLHEWIGGNRCGGEEVKRLLDALPPKAPTFTDEQALAFHRRWADAIEALYPQEATDG